jgi:Zn-finger nucleic acid-binding protein
MTEHPLGPVQVEECPTCHGYWFEAEELRLAKDSADPYLRWLDFDLWSDQAQVAARPGGRACPSCTRRLTTLEYGDTKVEIDACPACKGLWLDESEFERIIAALEDEVTSKHFSEYLRATVQEAREIFAGPESTASEWRDFTTVLRLAQYRLLVEHGGLRKTLLALQEANPFK